MSKKDKRLNEKEMHVPLNGTLDLHHFAPKDTTSVVEEYVRACHEAGIFALRIVHGKGTGTKREIVHAVLARSPLVASFRHEGGSGGGWGATVVDLKPDRNE